MYITYSILHTVYYIHYITYCILHTVYYILYIMYCILHTKNKIGLICQKRTETISQQLPFKIIYKNDYMFKYIYIYIIKSK